MGTLGTGHNEAWLYDRAGQRAIAPLENTSSLRWGRAKNAISTAEVEVLTGQHAECCSVLGQIGTWGHSLVMFRDGLRVWEGPITNIKWRRGGVSIVGHDVLGWAMRKGTPARPVTTPAYAVNEMASIVGQVFSGFDPNVLAHLVTLGSGTGPTVTRDVKEWGGYHDDQLNEMVKGGANFTVVGRRIVLWPSGYLVGRGAPLLPADHMSGEVEVEEDGFDVSTVAAFVNDADPPVAGVATRGGAGGVDPYYGRLEAVEPFAGTDSTALTASANAYLDDHYPARVKVNVPQGSVLSCDAPYTIEELVPGTVVPVKIDSGMCLLVDATPDLSAVEVTDGAAGEKVAITLGGDDGSSSGIEGWMRKVERRQYEQDRRIRSI